jgi:clan AA aspartic protease
MGTFRVEVTVSNLRDPRRSVTLPLLVDTGATYTTLPGEVAESLGLEPVDTRRVRLGDGREEHWPLGEIRARVDERECPSVCFIGPRGGPALLGAVTLEELALDVDATGKRLVPATSIV